MPKIEVDKQVFFALAGQSWDKKEEFEEALVCAKGELDSDYSDDILKLELNDTNRPDLWSTAGAARQLRLYNSEASATDSYPFFSAPGKIKKANYKVIVEKSVASVRPFLAGFVARGRKLSDELLIDIIQTQEKLSFNFGRRRRSISMGIYRTGIINWPIIYKGVEPDTVSFEPLQWEGKLTLSEILKQHPKGREFAAILEKEKIHPLLVDSKGEILSYPPIINSSDLGAVQVGDSELFVELTGTDIHSLTLAASIVACDLADNGFTIEPIEIDYDYDTPFGKKCISPYYFQEKVFCSFKRIEKYLGIALNASQCINALARMGVKAAEAKDREKGDSEVLEGILAEPPPYRNDFLHAVDVMEDVMMGLGLKFFKPERPSDFTIGRLTAITLFSRTVKELMTGLGFQEMIFNYLGSGKNFIEKMRSDGKKILHISNPMTENYEYVRDSIIASLMDSESASGHVAYPHKIFEVGKIAYKDNSDNYGSVTKQYLGFLHADREANFNSISSQIQTLFYYLSCEYDLEESSDTRFIPGRAASIIYKGKPIGVFGELHPELLVNWGVGLPASAGEIDIEALL